MKVLLISANMSAMELILFSISKPVTIGRLESFVRNISGSLAGDLTGDLVGDFIGTLLGDAEFLRVFADGNISRGGSIFAAKA